MIHDKGTKYNKKFITLIKNCNRAKFHDSDRAQNISILKMRNDFTLDM